MFEQMRKEKIAHIEKVLVKYLPKEEGYAAKVMEAMNYSALAGGKRLRPMLMEETLADSLFDKEDDLLESGESLQDYFEEMNDYLDGNMNV